jgi:hypothetical protein
MQARHRKMVVAGNASHASGIPRNIASGMRLPGFGGAGVSNGTNTTQNYRSYHFNDCGVAITNGAIMFSGWYTNLTNEQNMPNNYVVTAAIEYPVGVFTKITWGGQTSCTVTPGANIVSDYVPIYIPPDTAFYLRNFITVPSGDVWPLSGGTLLSEDSCAVGVGLSDMTMGGTITGSYDGLRPSAFLSATRGARRISAAGVGDSIMQGSGDVGFDSHGNIAWLGRACSGNSPYIMAAVGGTTASASAEAGAFASRVQAFQMAGVTHVFCGYGVNDLSEGSTPAELEADILILANQVVAANMKYIHTTLTPQASSTQKWYNESSQTIEGTSTYKIEVNEWIRTCPAPLFTYVENAFCVESSPNSTLWGTNPGQNTPYLAPYDLWTVGAGATATSVPSNSTRPSSGTSYYLGGSVLFMTGALAGTFAGISSYSLTGGTFTFAGSVLPEAPSAGDTFVAYPTTSAPTGDGTHPSVEGGQAPVRVADGHIELMHNVIPLLQSLAL